jgi:hypothetical protein
MQQLLQSLPTGVGGRWRSDFMGSVFVAFSQLNRVTSQLERLRMVACSYGGVHWHQHRQNNLCGTEAGGKAPAWLQGTSILLFQA